MTAEDTAKELVNKFIELTKDWDELDGYVVNKYAAKECAFITVYELIEFEKRIIEQLYKITKDAGKQFKVEAEFWQQVKQEIEKL